MTSEDERLVHSSWHTSYWKVHAHKRIPRAVYEPYQDSRIGRLINRGRVLVTYLAEVPDEILGWSCVQGSTLHYVYVRGTYRRLGIASALVSPSLREYTHATDKAGEAFLSHKMLTFNPYLLELP